MIGNVAIYEAVSSCCYPYKTRDYVGKNILDLYKLNNTTQFFKVVLNSEKIMVASYNVSVIFKSKTNLVPVLIYFPKDFPKCPPDIYVDIKENQGINPKNKDIDPKTKKMSIGTLRAWGLHSTIQGVVKDIEISFQKEFPVYNLSNEIGKSSINKSDFTSILNLEECFSQYNNVNSNSKSNNNINNSTWNNNSNWNNTSNINNSNWNSGNNSNWNNSNSNNNNNWNSNNNNNWNSNNNNNKGNWNNNNDVSQPGYDKVINNIVDYNNTSKVPSYNNPGNLDINSNLNTNKYSWNNDISSSYYDINQINSNSNNNNNNYNNSIWNNNNFSNSKFEQKSNSVDYTLEIKKKLIEEIKKSVEVKLQEKAKIISLDMEKLNLFKKDMLNFKEKYNQFLLFKNKSVEKYINKNKMIDQEIYDLKSKVNELKQISMNEDNFQNFITKKYPNLLRAVSLEATVEDLLLVIENAYNKGSLEFNESLNLYRSAAKEIVKLKYYSKKLSN